MAALMKMTAKQFQIGKTIMSEKIFIRFHNGYHKDPEDTEYLYDGNGHCPYTSDIKEAIAFDTMGQAAMVHAVLSQTGVMNHWEIVKRNVEE